MNTMSRKAATAAAGQRRRSPRISALDSCKKNHEKGQPKRRNLDSKLAKQVWKGREYLVTTEWRSLTGYQKHDHNNHTLITNGNSNGSASVMPAKHTLELVLDTLQRRDTYEIFAQPVDPDEVEDYYEIIKEPMDFGTMRAKLHEGMYQNLEHFEHDVFLIPENAMHFNSSTTTYFRQARAIHELANKVFHVLKTNPQNFASEFSGTRRRSMRKALRDDSIATSAVCPSTSAFRKAPAAFHFNDSGDSRVADRRDAYLSKKEDHPQTYYNSSSRAQLVLMNQGEISYEDSLMWYVKELGPMAQMVAKRKLLGRHESSNTKRRSCGGGVAAKEFKTFRDFALAGGCNPFLNTVIDLAEETKLRHHSRRKDKAAAAAAAATKNRNPVSMVRDLNCSSRPVILALENHHSQLFKSRNKKSLLSKEPSRPVFDEASKQQQQHKPLPLISHFTFDLPFLKARLDQMKGVDMRKGALSLT